MKKKKVERKTIELFKRIAEIMAPPPDLKVSTWADRYRRLSVESSAEPGRWITDRAPYQREIMDCVTETDVQDVVVMTSSQVGKTEILLNIAAYFIDYDPSPMMIVQPTEALAQTFSKDRLQPMVRDTPKLAGKISDAKSRDSDNTILHKKFSGGHVTMIGANAPSNLASRPIRVVLCDEVDRYPASAGTEGDVITLVEKRTNNFWNRKKVKFSTPTIKGKSKIEREYLQGSMGEWCVPCPCCGTYQPYNWGRINFKDATMECENCHEAFTKSEWAEGTGKWIHKFPENPKRSFHLNEMASPWRRWEEIIEDFKKANKELKENGNVEELKAFINTALGEPWEIKGKTADESTLLERREEYKADLPNGVVLLTAGVDVQDNRFEIEVVGWRKGFESYGILYKTIFCDPGKESSWNTLEEFLETEFRFENGNGLLIAATCVDTGGHHTDDCYKWLKVMEKKQKKIYGIKGMGGAGIPLIYKESRNTKNKVRIFILGVDSGKEKILTRLSVAEAGPGYCHFPNNKELGYNETYIKGLNSEQLVTKMVKGRPKSEWIKKSGTRNETLDVRNYATAAAEILNPNWDGLQKKIDAGINYMVKKPSTKIRRKGTVRGLMQ